MKDGISSIGDYGIIGDCRSAALVSREGALDWLCWPRFDSPAMFAGLLDHHRGGRWQVSPRGDFRSTRRYIPNTNVLETRFETGHGTALLTDFMPLADEQYRHSHLAPDQAVVRLLRCESGSVDMEIRFAPRPDFGMAEAKLVDRGKLGLRCSAGRGILALYSDARFEIDHGVASATVRMTSGDELPLILTYAESAPAVMPVLCDAGQSLVRTVDWWQQWAASTRYDGPYRDAVVRSVLTLKLLEFPTTGAFVAAPTTSLPERLGGTLNWDYRYCWLRDASFTIEVLLGLGFVAEAEAFAEWLLHATRRTQPRLMVMYDLYGNAAPRERRLPHLAGYQHSSPVHVGNGARDQSQLDTYGEVVSGVAMLLKHKGQPADRETSKVLVGFGQYVCDHWRQPDAGIWETRGKPAVHTHSRLACWVALDALLDLHHNQLVRGVPVERFTHTRDAIRRSIEMDSWDPVTSTYVNEPGTTKVDASLLRMAIHGFDDPSSERMRQTQQRVCDVLGAGGPLLYRNLPPNGEPNEGAFGICGFWRAHVIAMGGPYLAEADDAFTALLATANDLGLFGEETDPASGAVLGNFPQAFTHLGLIAAARAIEKRRAEATIR